MGNIFKCLCFGCLPECIKLRCIEKKKYSFPFKRYKTFVQEVIDGDTFHITFFMEKTPVTMKIRLIGIDAPEKSSKNPLEKKASEMLTKYLKQRLEGKYFDCELFRWDKYGGRVVGHLYVRKNYSISDILISRKLVKCYEGNKKEEWTNEELNHIYNFDYTNMKLT
jgi:endonuclease YncB( thermonuclease family)